MNATLTKIGNQFGCRVKGTMPEKSGKALIEVEIKPTTQRRVIIKIPKTTKIYFG